MDRPSLKSVQRSLLVGLLAGLLVGLVVGLIYAWWWDPATYSGGSYPSELTNRYKNDYVALVGDSYTINRQLDNARERLSTINPAVKIRALAERSIALAANGQAVESQAINELAAQLKAAENWNADTVRNIVGDLSSKYSGDPAKSGAVDAFSTALLNQVPQAQQPQQPPAEGQQPPAPEGEQPPPPAEEGGGLSWLVYALLCLVIVLAMGIAAYLYKRFILDKDAKGPEKPEVAWEGEGPAPIKQWSGTYTLGQDTYDEFFTIETEDSDFLGESGMGILDAKPGTDPKEVFSFDVGLFDKTDITTLSRVVMTEKAYNDEDARTKVENNPQAEAILAEPGKEFTLETSAIRIVATIDDMELDESRSYFEKLSVSLDVFIKEGVDLRIGTMDVPEEFQSN